MSARKVILLVSGNSDDALLMRRALERNGVEGNVVVASDWVEALEYVFGGSRADGEGKRPLPAMVLLDLDLQPVDGLLVLRQLRAEERTKTIPVVVLSSSAAADEISLSYAAGANSVIYKPVSFARFSQAIGQVGAYWLGLNQCPPAPDRG